MILRKPYAFFIRMFKPINFGLSIISAYLIYLDNNILSFLSSYVYSASTTSVNNIQEKLMNNSLFVLPIIVIIFSVLIMGIMLRKKKPTLFYGINIVFFIVILVIHAYVGNFLGVMEKTTVAIKSVKWMHDMILINMGLESAAFVVLLVRGMGINFKKFDFDSEISKFNISESDKEEFELSINLDLNESKAKRKRKLRNLMYEYKEKKLLYNFIAAIIVVGIAILVYFIMQPKKYNVEGIIYSTSYFDFVVDDTILLNADYKGNKLTDDDLVIVRVRLSSYMNKSLYLKDFNLKIGEAVFSPSSRYNKSLIDLGTPYDGSTLVNDFISYIFIYEVPKKYENGTMIFRYNDEGVITEVKLNPNFLVSESVSIEKSIGEEISFEKTLGDIIFKINDYELKDKFKIKYDYCVDENDCVESYEYLRPTLNTNFDKYVLRLSVDYKDNSGLGLNTFYNLFSRFGAISYKINDKWYYQNGNFEELKSNKKDAGKNVYIGVNSEISKATEMKLSFNIRQSLYEYVLK